MTTRKQIFDWCQNACRIAAAFNLNAVMFIDFFGPAALFSTNILSTKEALSSPISEAYFRDGTFIKEAIRIKNRNARDAEVRLVRAYDLLGVDASGRVAAYEQYRKEPFPRMTAHEQLEAHLQFRERMENHCRENGVPVPPRP